MANKMMMMITDSVKKPRDAYGLSAIAGLLIFVLLSTSCG